MTTKPDLFMMTTAVYHRIRDNVASVAADEGLPVPLTDSDLFGSPVEHYPTLQQVHERAREAHTAGQSVMLILE